MDKGTSSAREVESLRRRVAELEAAASKHSSAETIRASEGSGLCTLRERLAALYCDQASLSTRSQGIRGFKVTVTVPWQDAVDRTEPVS